MAPISELASAPQHLLSLARVVLGVVVFADVGAGGRSPWALPCTGLAIALDFADGRIARARGTSSTAGRVVDNACDAAFLGLAFFAFRGEIGFGPLAAFGLAFGAYGARALAATTLGWRMTPSPRGHWAGIVNYATALVAAAHASPFLATPVVALRVVVVVSVSLNALALYDNLRLAWTDRRATKRG